MAAQQRPLTEVQLGKKYGVGFKLLQKMGFESGKGLGSEKEGIVAPLNVVGATRGEGISENMLKKLDNTKNAVDESQHVRDKVFGHDRTNEPKIVKKKRKMT